MQSIIHTYDNIHPIFDDFEKMYAELSEKHKKHKAVNHAYPDIFKPLFDLFSEYGYDGNITYRYLIYPEIDKASKKKQIIVCFSGGKDSTATALYYKNKGYRVYLYHLRGINKMFKDEYKVAEKVADKLNIPLIIEDIKLKGWVRPDYFEHPMKNMIIANRTIEWAVNNDKPIRIAFGNFSTSTLKNDPFEVCGGDCKELWQIYNDIMQTVIPGFKVETPLVNMHDSLITLFHHKSIIKDVQSCITPYNYKVRLRKRNEKKYGFSLPENRCGSCWKCAVEYIVYADEDIWEYNEQWYKHCLEILKNTLKKEQNINIKELSEVWEYYFFYSISQSKYFN